MKKSAAAAVGIGLIALVVAGAWYWWAHETAASTGVVAAPAAEPASAPSAPIPLAASEPGIKHPIQAPAAAAPAAPPAAALDVESMLTDIFGRKSALGPFQLNDFARRVVATVDNLGRSHAPSRLWPVNPTERRFMTARRGDAEVISADNGLRYTPYVSLIETVDLHQVVAAYGRLYPLLQGAYEDLGYPRRYFNDRVVEVPDQLAATPDVNGPLKVRLPAINGPMQPQRPWGPLRIRGPLA